MNAYLSNVRKIFTNYKTLGEKTFKQLTDDQLFWQYNEESLSIATIVKHLHGNMLSRWTEFMTTDGEKMWRNRDGEFESDINSREEMMRRWDEGWACLFDAIDPLQEQDLSRKIFIRNQGHTVLEAINRQLTHYAYHVGQIVFIGKMLAENWESLSIPMGKSKEYNLEKFGWKN